MEPEYVLTLSLRDRHGFGPPLEMAVNLRDEVRISPRAVDDMKLGLCGSVDGAISLMRRREFRKDLFIGTARRLGALLAERMEDAEGWHDARRIKPARKELGGTWPRY